MLNIFKEDKLDKRDSINLLILIMIFSGIFGFIYETIFYRIDLGYFVKRGSTYGPWIPIYVFGGLFITLLTYRYKDKPLLVFLLGTIISGILEYGTGYVFYEFFNTRLWDYNKEIWNFGNINGYICLRSVLFFGISGLFLVYLVIPLLIKLINKIKGSFLNKFCIIIMALFVIDVFTYMIIN